MDAHTDERTDAQATARQCQNNFPTHYSDMTTVNKMKIQCDF